MRLVKVLTAVNELLTREFDYPIYSDEVLEGFNVPCFFVRYLPHVTQGNVNTFYNELTIVITYFGRHDQLEDMDVVDRIVHTLGNGFRVEDRFIHVNDISPTHIGEKNDILQVRLEMNYYTRNGHVVNTGEEAGSVEVALSGLNKEDKEARL